MIDRAYSEDGLIVGASARYRELSSLPDSFGALGSIKRLDLTGNRFSIFPEEILGLRDLQSIYLDSNRLSSLPDSADCLINLSELHLDGNDFLSFPTVIKRLTNLMS